MIAPKGKNINNDPRSKLIRMLEAENLNYETADDNSDDEE